MKIAILIISHKNKEQLEFLISFFEHPSYTVYLHVDKLADFSYKDIRGNFVPLLNNYACAWGSYDVVKVTFDLLKLAYKGNNDYYLLISGQDFPIKSLNFILNFFKVNEGKSFIHNIPFQSYIPKERIENAYNRLEYFHIPKRPPLNFCEKIKFSIFYRISNYQRMFDFLKLPIPDGLFFGENWFNLHKDLVGVLLRGYDTSYLLRFRLSFGNNMEEVLPHTLINSFNSLPFNIISNSLRFTKWNHPSAHPEILKFEDLQDFAFNSNALFARKFEDLTELRKLKDFIDGN